MQRNRKGGNPDPSQSQRWPNLFGNAEQAEVLLQEPSFQLLLADLQRVVEQRSHEIIHNVPYTQEAKDADNYWRGKISAFEDLLGLAEELREWKESQKK